MKVGSDPVTLAPGWAQPGGPEAPGALAIQSQGGHFVCVE